MITEQKFFDALANLPKKDQLLVDWIRNNGWTVADFIEFVTPTHRRRDLIKAGLKLRVASYERTKDARKFVMISGVPYADIRGK